MLPKVATDDRTVIITSVNEAFARPNSLLGLFRESFQVGEGIGHLLDNVLVVAVDAKAFDQLLQGRAPTLLPPAGEDHGPQLRQQLHDRGLR